MNSKNAHLFIPVGWVFIAASIVLAITGRNVIRSVPLALLGVTIIWLAKSRLASASIERGEDGHEESDG